MGFRALNTLWLALACVAGAHASACEAQAAAEVRPETRADAIRAVLEKCRAQREIAPETLALELAHLGDAAIPDLFAALTQVPDPMGVDPIGPNATVRHSRERQLVLAALARLSRAALLGHVERVAAADADTGSRVGALDVLARIGSANEIELVRKLASVHDAGGDALDALARGSRSAVAGICARDASALAVLEKEYSRFPAPFRPSLLEGLAASRATGAPALLADSIERDEANQVLALSLLSSLADSIPRPVDERTLSLVRRLVADSDGEILSEAELAAGKLGDYASIPRLIDLLASPRRCVRANALWSLRRLTLLDLRDDPAHWRAWYREESAWWAHESRRVLQKLASPDPTDVKSALTEVARRSIRREELALETLRALDRGDAGVAALACHALGHLRAPVAVPSLVPHLSDRDPAVRTAAWNALKRITGKSLPADAEAWRALADSASSRGG
jgi:hypothetical protein